LQNTPREADVVIPNQFDPDELPHGDGGDYLLFVGRITLLKGLEYACAISNALDLPLIVAGPGGSQPEWDLLRGEGGREWRCSNLEYVGAVGVEERARLMGGAAVTLMPTLYAEPFGGVAVESMMCGTPVVTTDFGAFPETVREGVSGYRFQTLQEAVDATESAMPLDRELVRDYALRRYSLKAVAPMYERWFDNLDLLWGEGFSKLREKELA
jgi:glycosyltransferase involved in cell wall biosynthesis